MARFDIVASIPGTVTVMHVEDGARVVDQETIMEIECMKTMWPVVSPAAGIFRSLVVVGEMIAQDQVLGTVDSE